MKVSERSLVRPTISVIGGRRVQCEAPEQSDARRTPGREAVSPEKALERFRRR